MGVDRLTTRNFSEYNKCVPGLERADTISEGRPLAITEIAFSPTQECTINSINFLVSLTSGNSRPDLQRGASRAQYDIVYDWHKVDFKQGSGGATLRSCRIFVI